MYWKLCLELFCLILFAGAALGASVSIAPDRMAVVDGQRAFILGLYENPEDDAVLQAVANAGFNLVRASASTEALDRLHAHGLGAWINTGGNIDLSDGRDQREQALRDVAAAHAQHPALLVWEVPDEALWNCWYGTVNWRRGFEPAQQREKIGLLADAALAEELRAQLDEVDRLHERGDFGASEELADDIWRKLGADPPHPELRLSACAQTAATMCQGMVEGCRLLKEIDPAHPVWMNHAPRNQIAQLAAFNEGADAVGCDIYPVPAYGGGHSDLADRSLASTGAFTLRMQEAAPGKPVWMVLQGFGWADLQKNPTEEVREEKRRPTFRESRFMAYDAIVRGARGILYWGTAYIEKDSEFWGDLLKLVRELADLQPVLAAPDAAIDATVTLAQTWGSVDRGVEILPKNVDGKVHLIVVNEFTDPLHYTINGLDDLEGTVYADPEDHREAKVTGGTLTLGIAGQGVQVLAPR